ncbi:B12-binding domain-containing radical SAM protein [Candidatus Woesearchaeota archaeon]|nr:B12-binding domain-containing radical SAM protein [Candidatus Woesearchaeota archaeon]
MKKICLIFPRMRYPSGDPPLGILYIASFLRNNIKDIELHFIDTTFNPSFEYLESKLKKARPDIVGIYMDTMMYVDALKTASIAKRSNSNVVIGGPHPTLLPETVINDNNVDAVILGEGEITFTEYIHEFYGNKNFEKIKGLWFKKDDKIIKNNFRKPIENLDELPFPALDLLDFGKYIKNWYHFSYLNEIRGTSIIGSRGCLFNCSYCQPTLQKLFGKKLRKRNPDSIISELRLLKKRYGINAFHLQDDTSTVSKKWMIDFCKALIKSGLRFCWSCNSRADTLDKEMLFWMKKSGLKEVRVGIESISPKIRNDLFKKNVSNQQIFNAIRLIKKFNLYAFGYFMIGAPGETENEIKNTINFAVNSKLDSATFSITTLLPGAYLYNEIIKNEPDLEDFQYYDYYNVSKKNFSELKRWKLDYYKKSAYLRFYLHPRRIIKTLKEISSIKKALLKLKRF